MDWSSRFSLEMDVSSYLLVFASCIVILAYRGFLSYTCTLILVNQNMSLYAGFIQLGAGLSVGLAGMAAGFAVGIVGDAGVRASAQQPRLFTGMVRLHLFMIISV